MQAPIPSQRSLRRMALVGCIALVACGRSELDPSGWFQDDPGPDAAVPPMDGGGPGDGAGLDAGPDVDAGAPGTDASVPDAGPPPDDSGPPPPDTGVPPACVDDADCDDGLVCNGQERCVDGVCVPGTPPDCDDGIACTVDRCREPHGCEHEPDHGACAGSFCDGEKQCDPERGCVVVSPVDCDDGDMCTRNWCDDALQRCESEPWVPPEADPYETVCDDGIDNDCDGLVDCDDPDCERPGECGCDTSESGVQCRDGIDNDCDGLVDCEDPDCAGTFWCTVCLPFQICEVPLDTNCNGLAGCDDPQCFLHPACN